jgi:hypothetical protein
MVTPEETIELLIRLDERSRTMNEKIDTLIAQASNGGWSRCRDNHRRIEILETEKGERRSNKTWFDRAVQGTVVALVLKSLWDPIARFFTLP